MKSRNFNDNDTSTNDSQTVFAGMRVLFDEKVGLYPVTLVEEPARRESASDA